MAVDISVKIDADTGDLEAQLRRVEQSINGLGKSTDENFRQVNNGLGDVAVQAKRSADQVDFFTSAITRIGSIAGPLYALDRVVTVVLGLGSAMLQAQARAESLETGLRFAVAGSAARELEYLRGVANNLGLDFQSTASSYMRFAAAARETTLEGEGARRVFEAVSKASVVMGLNVEQNEGVLLSLSQMISKGTVQSEELRGQLGERLPGAFQIAARSMGVTTEELGKMLEQGQVLATDFLPKFAVQLETELGGAAENAANRTEASMNRMTNAWELLKQTMATSGLGDFAKNQVDQLTGSLNAASIGMQRARDEGDGFIGQIATGIGYMATYSGAFRGFGDVTSNAGAKLAEARAELAQLQARLEMAPNSPYIKQSIVDTQRLITVLQGANAETAKLINLRAVDNASLAAADRLAVAGAQEKAKADAELAKIKGQLRGVQEGYLGTLSKLESAYRSGSLTESEYRDLVTDLAKKNYQKEASSRAVGSAQAAERKELADLRREHEAQQDVLMSVLGFTKTYADDTRRLTALYASGQITLDQLTESYNKLLAKQPGAIALVKEEADARKQAIEVAKAQNKEFDAYFDQLEKERLAVEKQINGARTYLERLQDETAALTQTRLERALSTAERELERQGIVRGTLAYEAYIDKIRQAVINKDTVQQTIDANKQIQDDWVKTSDAIYQSVTDSIFRGTEDGKGFFENLADTAKGIFRNLVLQPTIRAGMSVVGSALGLSGTANAASAAGAAGNGLSALNGLGSLVGLGELGSTVGGYLSSGAAAVSGWLSGTGIGASSATGAGALATNAALAESAVAGGVAAGGGAMSAIAAAAPYVAAVLAVYALAQKTKGETRGGGQYGYGVTGSGTFGTDGVSFLSGPSGGQIEADTVRSAIESTIGGINSTLAALGSSATLTGFQAALETSTKGRGGVYAGGTLSTGARFGELGLGGGRSNYDGTLYETTSATTLDGAAALKNFSEDLLQATVQALQAATDIPKSVQSMLAGIDAEALSAEKAAELVANINSWAAAMNAATDQLAPLGGVFTRVSQLSIDARDQLFAFSGGIEKFISNTRSYVDQYFSEAEKAAITAADIVRRLQDVGIEADLTTRESLRTLVEGTDVSTETGRKQLAVLLDVADEFASISEYLQAQGSTLEALADTAPQDDLLKSLNEASVAAQELTYEAIGALDDTTAGIGESIAGAVDSSAAADKQHHVELVAAMQAQAERIDEMAEDQRTGLATIVSGLSNQFKLWDSVTQGGTALRTVAAP